MTFSLSRPLNSSPGTIPWSVVLPSGHATAGLSNTALQISVSPGRLLSFPHLFDSQRGPDCLRPTLGWNRSRFVNLQYAAMGHPLHWKSASIGIAVTPRGPYSSSSIRKPRRNSVISLLLSAFCIGGFLWFNADQVSPSRQLFEAFFDVLTDVVANQQPPICLGTSLKTSVLQRRCSLELVQCACTPPCHPSLHTRRKPLQIDPITERSTLPSPNPAEYSI